MRGSALVRIGKLLCAIVLSNPSRGALGLRNRIDQARRALSSRYKIEIIPSIAACTDRPPMRSVCFHRLLHPTVAVVPLFRLY